MFCWSHPLPLIHIFWSILTAAIFLNWKIFKLFSISLRLHSWREQKEANLNNLRKDFLPIILKLISSPFPWFSDFLQSFFPISNASHRVVKLLKFDFPRKFCWKWRTCWFNFHFARRLLNMRLVLAFGFFF